MLFDVAKMRGAWEWRDAMRDKLTVGIGFHTRSRTLFSRHTPGVCVALHQCLPRSAVRRSAL